MNEVLTVLTSATGHPLVKSCSGTDITPQPFSTGKLFNVTEETVSDLHSLSALLQRLEDKPTHTVIRGSLKDGQNSPVPRNKETFIATPRQWYMIALVVKPFGTARSGQNKRTCQSQPMILAIMT